MKITLDPNLERVAPREAPDFAEMIAGHHRNIARALGYNGYRSEKTMTWLGSNLDPDSEMLHGGYVGLLSRAYSNHEKVRVTPHDLWFIVMSQIAKIINENSEACRTLFSTSAEKVEIQVPTSDVTTIDPIVLMQYLANRVPANTKLFVPELSTNDHHIMAAMCAVFADAVQSYYDYSTFLCGIPEIEVTGTVKDWETLTENSITISKIFREIGLERASDYMARIANFFDMIEVDVNRGEVDVNFWKDIFRSKNIGSGGELEINGWIVEFFYDKPRVKKIENFLFTLGTFPYSNQETGRKFRTVYGAFEQLRSPEGFIYSGYGNVVYELPK